MSKDTTDIYYLLKEIQHTMKEANKLKLVELYLAYGEVAVDGNIEFVERK